MSRDLRVIVHASELLTGAGVRAKDGRRVLEEDLGRIQDGAIVFEEPPRKVKNRGLIGVPGKILWVGKTSELPKTYLNFKKEDLKLKQAVVPGLVDCHTHLVFAGDRAAEFADRCGGVSYQEIAARGGGIQTTVNATRAKNTEELLSTARARLSQSMFYGVRAIEIKSGYGLSKEAELKILKVVRELKEEFPEIEIQSTFLGAHSWPKDETPENYWEIVTQKLLPKIAEERLADACDIFVDEGYFTRDQARELLTQAKGLGLKIKIHADELGNTESAALAAELGALSADHLLCISDRGIMKLAESDTTAVLLPGTAFYLKAPHAPARRLIDAGARVAISTDFNPGTSPTLNLPAVLTISALYLGMTRAELFASVTYNAACALGIQSTVGTLEPGMRAQTWVMPFERFEECYYRFAW